MIVSRKVATRLIETARQSKSGLVKALRSVQLGADESVTYDPFHVPDDPSHRWSGLSTDDIYVGIERATDIEGQVALRGKVGLMNRPPTRVISQPAALPADATFVLRGFETATESDKPMVQLVLADIGNEDAPSPRSGDPQNAYRIVHRDGTLIRGQCASVAEVLKLCGEAPQIVNAEGARQPPRISLDSPSWEIEITKRCDDADLEQIARVSRLRSLTLDGCSLSDAGLASLEVQTGLTNLNISAVERLGGQWIPALAKMESLVALHVQRADFDEEATNVLASLPRLRRLELTQCGISGDAIARLRAAPALNDLDLSDSVLGTVDVHRLADLTNLTILDLDGVRLESMPDPRPLVNGDIVLLGRLRNLTHLDVKNSRVSITGLTQLGELPRLYVDHRHSRVSEVDAQILANRFGWTFHGACSCGCLDIEPRR